MDVPNINFNEYKFDPAPYKIAVNSLSQKIQDNNFGIDSSSKTTSKQIDTFNSQISEKMEVCSQIAEEIKKVRVDNFNMQMDLKALLKEEEHLSETNLDLKEVLKNTCKVTFVQNNEEFRMLTQKIQMSLGLKLKLLQCQDNPRLWVATFLFDVSSELVILYNTEDESFTLRNMKPKHHRFTEMAKFFKNTNDITGLLYNCWKYFETSSHN